MEASRTQEDDDLVGDPRTEKRAKPPRKDPRVHRNRALRKALEAGEPKKFVQVTKEGKIDGRGAQPGSRGQQPFSADDIKRAKVSLWASMGITTDKIAVLLCCSEATVKKHYGVELKDNGAYAVGKVASSLFDKAVAGDTQSMIFYLKTRGRWSEKPALGDADNPIVIQGRSVSPQEIAFTLARRLREERADRSILIEHQPVDE